MIVTKQDLVEYLNCDKRALGITWSRPRLFRDEIWKFEILLRKTEFAFNNKKSLYGKFRYNLHQFRFHRMSLKLGFSIPLNVFGKGLSIAHYGCIVVNHNAKVGEFCRIQENVTIGATNGEKKSPLIGSNVFIGSGAKIIGDITIADGVAIGAGAGVIKPVYEPHITVAGVPAKKVSNYDSSCFMQMRNE